MKTSYRLRFGPRILAPLSCLVWSLAAGQPQSPSPWQTIPLQQPRKWHTATLMNDGKVLIVGGERLTDRVQNVSDGPSNTTEIFDPALNSFVSGPRLLEPRVFHAAAGLPNGVLIAGGRNLRSALIFDPVSHTLRETRSMFVDRQEFSAVPLAGGRVLVFGGGGRERYLIAEIYHSTKGEFTRTGDLIVRRFGCPGTLLKDGRVLLTGGTSSEPATYNKRLADAELFDPASGKFQRTGSLVRSRWGHTATLLEDGRVLIAGGINEEEGLTASAEIYDPAKGTFRAISPMQFRRSSHAAVLLPDGRVLIAGGASRVRMRDDILSSTEIFDPKTETFAPAKPMASPRQDHTATLLNDGRVLVVGGWTGKGESKTAELLRVEAR